MLAWLVPPLVLAGIFWRGCENLTTETLVMIDESTHDRNSVFRPLSLLDSLGVEMIADVGVVTDETLDTIAIIGFIAAFPEMTEPIIRTVRSTVASLQSHVESSLMYPHFGMSVLLALSQLGTRSTPETDNMRGLVGSVIERLESLTEPMALRRIESAYMRMMSVLDHEIFGEVVLRVYINIALLSCVSASSPSIPEIAFQELAIRMTEEPLIGTALERLLLNTEKHLAAIVEGALPSFFEQRYGDNSWFHR